MRLKDNTIYCGDSIRYMQHFVESKEEPFVNTIISDIPYQISRKNQFKTMGREGFDWDWDYDFYTDDLKYLTNVLKPGGSIVLFMAFQQIEEVEDILVSSGLVAKDVMIARKLNPIPRNTYRRYVPAIEAIRWFVKPGQKWTFNKRPDKTYETGIFEAAIPLSLKQYHPASKPISILEELIYIHSNPGDFILDPFAGCASTAIAASNMNRTFATMEIDQKLYDKSVELLTKQGVKFEEGNI